MARSASSARSVNPAMRVMSLAIPGFLALCVGYELYAVLSYILIDQFRNQYNDTSLAIGLLVPYIVIAVLMVASYLRLFFTIRINPGVSALGSEAARAFYGSPTAKTDTRQGTAWCGRRSTNNKNASVATDKPHSSRSGGSDSVHGVDLESGLVASPPYGSTPGGFGAVPFGRDPRMDPDSPGLELFYTKDVFECSPDGRPIFCSSCGTWKPDRAHHCSELNRCVRKMDHYCPWVGGVISETTFKFFLQFTYYATVLCGMSIGICAYALWRKNHLGHATDARIVVGLALAGFLGLFSFAMAGTCTTYVFSNATAVEAHQLKSRTKMMAVRIQRGSPGVHGKYEVITYPLRNDDAQYSFTTTEQAWQAHQAQQQQRARRPAASGADTEEPDPFKVAREARAARRAARDMLAFRTYAIVPVKMGINVWDLGWRANWTSVMGTNVCDWLLPLRASPCCNHESTGSLYPLGAEFRKICADLQLPPCRDEAQQW